MRVIIVIEGNRLWDKVANGNSETTTWEVKISKDGEVESHDFMSYGGEFYTKDNYHNLLCVNEEDKASNVAAYLNKTNNWN